MHARLRISPAIDVSVGFHCRLGNRNRLCVPRGIAQSSITMHVQIIGDSIEKLFNWVIAVLLLSFVRSATRKREEERVVRTSNSTFASSRYY